MQVGSERRMRVRRKPGRAVRFDGVKVGDQLMKRVVQRWSTPAKDDRAANDIPWLEHEKDCGLTYAIVTDLWFDPVKGETDSVAGEMVAIRWLRQGREIGSKQPHTKRGLAMQGWHYADRDEIVHWEAVRAAVEAGDVIGIGKGQRGRKSDRLYRL